MEMQRKVLQRKDCEIEITTWRLPVEELTALDNRVQGYWIKRTFATYGDSSFGTEMFCCWSKADVQRVVNELLGNVLTAAVIIENESKTWKCQYQIKWSTEMYGVQQEVLSTMRANHVDQWLGKPKGTGSVKIGQEAIDRAIYVRKLQKALQHLQQDSGEAIQFRVRTTNYELSRGATGYILRRNGKVIKIIGDGDEQK